MAHTSNKVKISIAVVGLLGLGLLVAYFSAKPDPRINNKYKYGDLLDCGLNASNEENIICGLEKASSHTRKCQITGTCNDLIGVYCPLPMSDDLSVFVFVN